MLTVKIILLRIEALLNCSAIRGRRKSVLDRYVCRMVGSMVLLGGFVGKLRSVIQQGYDSGSKFGGFVDVGLEMSWCCRFWKT